MNEFAELNEYYNLNPPQFIIDDLGLYHPIEIPLPGKYARKACACNIVHKWSNPPTFEIYNMHIFTNVSTGEKTYKEVKKCLACGEKLSLELIDK